MNRKKGASTKEPIMIKIREKSSGPLMPSLRSRRPTPRQQQYIRKKNSSLYMLDPNILHHHLSIYVYVFVKNPKKSSFCLSTETVSMCVCVCVYIEWNWKSRKKGIKEKNENSISKFFGSSKLAFKHQYIAIL